MLFIDQLVRSKATCSSKPTSISNISLQRNGLNLQLLTVAIALSIKSCSRVIFTYILPSINICNQILSHDIFQARNNLDHFGSGRGERYTQCTKKTQLK